MLQRAAHESAYRHAQEQQRRLWLRRARLQRQLDTLTEMTAELDAEAAVAAAQRDEDLLLGPRDRGDDSLDLDPDLDLDADLGLDLVPKRVLGRGGVGAGAGALDVDVDLADEQLWEAVWELKAAVAALSPGRDYEARSGGGGGGRARSPGFDHPTAAMPQPTPHHQHSIRAPPQQQQQHSSSSPSNKGPSTPGQPGAPPHAALYSPPRFPTSQALVQP